MKVRGWLPYAIIAVLVLIIAGTCTSQRLSRLRFGGLAEDKLDYPSLGALFTEETESGSQALRYAGVEAAPPAPAEAPPAELPPAAAAGQSFDLAAWFSPAAYAAEHPASDEYLIRSGELTLKIDDYAQTEQDARAVAERYSGTVTDANMEKYADGTHQGWLTLRLPREHFFDAWADLLALGEVVKQNISSRDVAQQYVAAVSRLENLMVEQKTLQEMLADAREVQRTRGLGEAYSVLLDTQARLSDVTYELQSTEDLIAQLADQIERSTVTLHLSERPVYAAEEFTWGIGETLGRAHRDLLLGLKGMVNGLLYFVVTMWLWLVPLLIVALIVYLIVRGAQRRRRGRVIRERPGPSNAELRQQDD